MRAVNLIPSEQRGGGTVGARSGGAVFLVLGLLGGLVVLAFLYGSSRHELQSRRTEAATLSARAAQVQAQAAQLAPYASFMALREQRLHSITQLIGGRFDWSNAMGELSRVLPREVSLSTLAGTIGASEAASAKAAPAAAGATGAVSSATPPGVIPSVTLGGCAGSQSTVAQMLVRLRLISGVSSVALQSSTKPGGGGSPSGSASVGPCPTSDPVFSVVVNFEPLPAAATPSIQALTSSTSGGATKGAKHTAAAVSSGGRVR
jgi:Tfp pilus assembly protein PilN